MTGTMTPVAFPGTGTTPLGYTMPDGQQILGTTASGSDNTIARYTQAGTLVQTLATGNDAYTASYSPDGTALAVPAAGGLLLVSNTGGMVRKLPVPGVSSKTTCEPVRWWTATTILADCTELGLWLVPSGGGAPSVLTPARHPGNAAHDLGDLDAWPLPFVVTATATELLMEQQGCHGSGGDLAWFNPATGAEQWIFRTGAGPAAVAYNDPADAARL